MLAYCGESVVPMQFILTLLLLVGLIMGCQRQAVPPPFMDDELRPGGEATVGLKPFPSFELPSANLPNSRLTDFHAGKALAHQPWVKAPTVTDARDGLGPLYNARTCLACHINGGRGEMPVDGSTPIFSALVRISIAAEGRTTGPLPEPTYGSQIQTQSVSIAHQFRNHPPQKPVSEAPPEAYVFIDWQSREFRYPDGRLVELRKPKLRFEKLGYGDFDPRLLTSLRAAPGIAGMGLLELIDQADLDDLADPEDVNNDGISGRVNRVWDSQQQRMRPGRFGWKANRASLAATVAGALQQDMGISNPVFSEQPCTDNQALCLQMATGEDALGFEINQPLLASVIEFTRNLGVPRVRQTAANQPVLSLGRQLFYQIGCPSCHQPSFKTRHVQGDRAHLGGQKIWPYSDLLLHDLGPELADGRPDFMASGNEWRTAPLWGAGLHSQVNGNRLYLHDGRARTIEEAILWHGGEAQSSRQGFINFAQHQRDALIQFVETR